jgi:hypothetical protein
MDSTSKGGFRFQHPKETLFAGLARCHKIKKKETDLKIQRAHERKYPSGAKRIEAQRSKQRGKCLRIMASDYVILLWEHYAPNMCVSSVQQSVQRRVERLYEVRSRFVSSKPRTTTGLWGSAGCEGVCSAHRRNFLTS